MDDFKILSDIQEHYQQGLVDRVQVTKCCDHESIQNELKDGKRWMRFATAGKKQRVLYYITISKARVKRPCLARAYFMLHK
jgi:hypothetical protein